MQRYQKTTWEDALGISFSTPVKFCGVSFIGVRGEKYDVKLEILSQVVEKTFDPQQLNKHLYGFDVILPSPVMVQAGSIVYLKATVSGRAFSYGVKVGEQLKNEIVKEENGTTVNFFDISRPGSTTVDKKLQIHEIIYSQI